MITAENLSIAVQERLEELGETPEAIVDSMRAVQKAAPSAMRTKLQAAVDDALLLRPAVARQLPNLAHLTVRRIERALGFSEFTLFALSADGRGLPEFGEEYVK